MDPVISPGADKPVLAIAAERHRAASFNALLRRLDAWPGGIARACAIFLPRREHRRLEGAVFALGFARRA